MFGQYQGKEPPSQDVSRNAGSKTKQQKGANEGYSVICSMVKSAVLNYTDHQLEIAPGVFFSQHHEINRAHRLLSSQFEDGRTEDDQGNTLFFHNIITPRNVHATKNIDLDTKDILVSTDNPAGWWFSFYLRNEMHKWMRDAGFGKLLNDLATNLPNHGKVIWKKTGEGEDMTLTQVDIRNVIFHPGASTIYPKDNPLFIERVPMYAWTIMESIRSAGWDRESCIEAIQAAQGKKQPFITTPGGGNDAEYQITDNIKLTDVWECTGYFPTACLNEIIGEPEDDDDYDASSDFTYAKCVIAGIDGGDTKILYATRMDEEDFNYKEFNYFRRVNGRCLPQSNTEVLANLQYRMNELVNRFFKALRMGSLHLFQTKGLTDHKNLLTDAEDGDIIEVKSEITPIATEIRAFQQYQTELSNIERQADMLANTQDVVTGESLPTNTPFRLGAQLGAAAGKIFEQSREDVGMVLTDVFWDWVLPEIVDQMSSEHILEVSGSVEELKMFDEAVRNYLAAQSTKEYIMQSNTRPTPEELEVIHKQIALDMQGKTRKASIPKGYFSIEKIKALRIYFDVTDERKNVAVERETMSTLFQVIAANPMVVESEPARMLLGRIFEGLNMSPQIIADMVSKPAAAPQALPGATAPAGSAPQQEGSAGVAPEAREAVPAA